MHPPKAPEPTQDVVSAQSKQRVGHQCVGDWIVGASDLERRETVVSLTGRDEVGVVGPYRVVQVSASQLG